MGVLLVCWCVVGVLLRCVAGVLLVFRVIYNCHNALWHFWGHLQVPQWVESLFSPLKGPQRVVVIIQHPERVVARTLCHNPFCAFLGAFWALKTLNERIRTLRLTYILNGLRLEYPMSNSLWSEVQSF